MAVWSRLTAAIAGLGIAGAGSAAVEPVLEVPRQKNWQAEPNRILGVETLAELVAQGLLELDNAAGEASRSGYRLTRLRALVQMKLEAPPYSEVLDLWRRGPTLPPAKRLSLAQVEHALGKAKIEPQYWPALLELLHARSPLADVAAGVQQGHLPNPGILPDVSPAVVPAQGAVAPATPDQQPPSHVPLTTLDLNPIDEAASHGFDLLRLRLAANLAGLPPGAHDLLSMWNRGLIDEASVDAGIREGHIKTKWAAAFKRLRWNVLGAAEYASAHLRGWIDQETMYRGGALTGHTTDQMDLLYLNRGRPLAPVQAFTAWARGAPHPVGQGYTARPGTFDETDFLRALKQSDVRDEYGPVLWHLRWAYPPLFQLGRLAQAGALKPERVRVILTRERYEPEDIDALIAFWYRGASSGGKGLTEAQLRLLAGGGLLTAAELVAGLEALGYSATAAGRLGELGDAAVVKTYKGKAIDATYKAFAGGQITEVQARGNLETAPLELGAAAIERLLALWKYEAVSLPAQAPPPPSVH